MAARTQARSQIPPPNPARRAHCRRIAVAGVIAAASALALVGSARTAVSSTLYGGFDADGTIYLTFADGTPIGSPTPPGTLIPAGTYTIDINNNSLDDLGNPHEFELTGPGVNLSAGTTATQLTWSATFQPSSTYTYEDQLNPGVQNEIFGTQGSGAGSGSTATTPATTGPTVPVAPSGSTTSPTDNNPLGTARSATLVYRGTLTGTVSSSGKLTLTFKRKNVGSLVRGRYTFTIVDRSRTSGFVLQEIHQPAVTITSAGFVGTRSLSVGLVTGQWVYYPSFIGKKTYFIVVNS
jgi:hypothetical protein